MKKFRFTLLNFRKVNRVPQKSGDSQHTLSINTLLENVCNDGENEIILEGLPPIIILFFKYIRKGKASLPS
jgi:hypothetical protein